MVRAVVELQKSLWGSRKRGVGQVLKKRSRGGGGAEKNKNLMFFSYNPPITIMAQRSGPPPPPLSPFKSFRGAFYRPPQTPQFQGFRKGAARAFGGPRSPSPPFKLHHWFEVQITL